MGYLCNVNFYRWNCSRGVYWMCAGFAATVGTVAAACLVATCVAQFYSAAPPPSCCCLSCWLPVACIR
jgi:hypothetical protein